MTEARDPIPGALAKDGATGIVGTVSGADDGGRVFLEIGPHVDWLCLPGDLVMLTGWPAPAAHDGTGGTRRHLRP